ncbi:MAG: phage shock protein PspA [Alphaproteobacteria bacterium]
MGIFSRLGDIVNANINAMLDRAEDPYKVIRMIVQEMEDTLVEVRATAAKAIAERKDLQRRIERCVAEAEDWRAKAEFALERDREDLARGALVARARLNERTDLLKEQMLVLEQTLSQTNDDIGQLESKLTDAKKRERALASRRMAHRRRHETRRHRIDERIHDAYARFDEIERGLDSLEGEAEAADMGQKKTLREEFAELQAEAVVERELQVLKESLKARAGVPAARATPDAGGSNAAE